MLTQSEQERLNNYRQMATLNHQQIDDYIDLLRKSAEPIPKEVKQKEVKEEPKEEEKPKEKRKPVKKRIRWL